MAPRWIKAIGHLKRAGEVVQCIGRVRNWMAVIAHFLEIARGYPIPFRTRSGIVARLDTYHDLVTAWVLFCRDEYRVPADANVVVDVGANIGLFSLYAAVAAPKANIIAIEPFPSCFQRLLAAVAENRLDERVACWELAVAREAGVRFMSANAVATQSNGLFPLGVPLDAEARIDVKAVTLLELLDQVRIHTGGRRIDFLKIDVEGAEHEFLTGLPPGALDHVARVGMEYHPNGDKKTLFEALARQGLKCVHDRQFGENVGVAHFDRDESIA